MIVLVVGDEPTRRHGIVETLAQLGCDVRELPNSTSVPARLRAVRPDVVLLDVAEVSGLPILESVRRAGSRLPVVLAGAQLSESGEKRALDLDADVVPQGTSIQVVFARLCKAHREGQRLRLTRHGRTFDTQGSLRERDWRLDRERMTVGDCRVTKLHVRLLAKLEDRAPGVVPYAELAAAAWNEPVDLKRLQDEMSRLFRRLGPLACHIRTVPGRGYGVAL